MGEDSKSPGISGGFFARLAFLKARLFLLLFLLFGTESIEAQTQLEQSEG
jgi:hypothetical protein